MSLWGRGSTWITVILEEELLALTQQIMFFILIISNVSLSWKIHPHTEHKFRAELYLAGISIWLQAISNLISNSEDSSGHDSRLCHLVNACVQSLDLSSHVLFAALQNPVLNIHIERLWPERDPLQWSGSTTQPSAPIYPLLILNSDESAYAVPWFLSD